MGQFPLGGKREPIKQPSFKPFAYKPFLYLLTNLAIVVIVFYKEVAI